MESNSSRRSIWEVVAVVVGIFAALVAIAAFVQKGPKGDPGPAGGAGPAGPAGPGAPVGTVVAFAGEPSKVPPGWRLCDGSTLVIADFRELFDAIGTASGGNATQFNLPDYRGHFLRGVADASGADPDKDSRAAPAPGGNGGNRVGSIQSDAVGSHTHRYHDSGIEDSGSRPSTPQTNPNWKPKGNTGTTEPNTNAGNETRPRNVYVNWIIKVKP